MARKKKGINDSQEIDELDWLREAYAESLDYNIKVIDENTDLRRENAQLTEELLRLRDENAILKQSSIPPLFAPTVPSSTVNRPTLSQPPAPYGNAPSMAAPRISPSPNDRISLFRAFFRGREDVYAKRWENQQTGRSGYVPACAKEWKRPYCTKPEKKCTECVYSPLTNEVIASHLAGHQTIGVYAMLPDDSCWFLAADFDGDHWQADAMAFLTTCRILQVPASLERSRSGNGGHIWIFFEMPISASVARKLGSAILTKTMEERHEIKFTSYDRFFPNQDTMPKGGFGNLIALPFQGKSARNGNSIFLDDNLKPCENQWAVLQSMQRVSTEHVEKLVDAANRDGAEVRVRLSMTDDEQADPWTQPSLAKKRERLISGVLPASIKIVQSNMLFVEKNGVGSPLLNRLKRLAAFQNPEFYKMQAMRMSTRETPRVIGCSDDFDQHVGMPRGTLGEIRELLAEYRISLDVVDERFYGKPLAVQFHGELRNDQAQAVAEIMKYDDGVLSATTAFGKTVVAAWLIAARQVNTLVLVHRQELLQQWRERLSTFLAIDAKLIGQIGGGKVKPTGTIDVAMVQSLSNKAGVKGLVADYGHVIIDECHHVAALSVEKILKQVKARYILGLTATPTRKDGHHPIIIMQCGPIRYRTNAKKQAENRPFDHVVFPRRTMIERPTAEITYQDLCAILVSDSARNELIATDIIASVQAGSSPLVLTERREHVDLLAARLAGKVDHVITMYGGRTKRERNDCLAKLQGIPKEESRILVATGRYIGEGFDDPRLDTLFLALPISWKGTLHQYAGRLHRLYDGKFEVRIYDYVDSNVTMAVTMFEKRKRGYKAMGYEIQPLI